MNYVEVLELKTFISHPPTITIEKRRFLVFSLAVEKKCKVSVQNHRRRAVTADSWITHSDSEYGLLLSIQITDSYMLNVTTKETMASQNGWAVKGWMIG